jgi:hypothetical protein
MSANWWVFTGALWAIAIAAAARLLARYLRSEARRLASTPAKPMDGDPLNTWERTRFDDMAARYHDIPPGAEEELFGLPKDRKDEV